MLSIIIPTLNEEKYLPLLLESIKRQELKEDKGDEDKSSSPPSSRKRDLVYEIIVADNNSKDKTRQIAQKYNCRITSGGLPARGRNTGARVAKGEMLLFLDADIVLPPGFLRKSISELGRRNLDIASYSILPKSGKKIIKKGFDVLYNWPASISQNFLPHGAMGILVKKEIFDKIGGFDEKIKIAEDIYFVRRGAKLGKFGIISSTKIFTSLRRFEKDGYAKTLLKYFGTALYMLSGKPVKTDMIKYDFGHYSPSEAKPREGGKERKSLFDYPKNKI